MWEIEKGKVDENMTFLCQHVALSFSTSMSGICCFPWYVEVQVFDAKCSVPSNELDTKMWLTGEWMELSTIKFLRFESSFGVSKIVFSSWAGMGSIFSMIECRQFLDPSLFFSFFVQLLLVYACSSLTSELYYIHSQLKSTQNCKIPMYLCNKWWDDRFYSSVCVGLEELCLFLQ